MDAEQKRLEKLERLDDMAAQLLPLLERSYNICLSESFFGKTKCNVGDINCTEINLLDDKCDCSVCVNGTMVSDTDDGDYCAHFVSLEKAKFKLDVKQDILKFQTDDCKSLKSISPKLTHSVKDNSNCNCSWAFYNYTYFSNIPNVSILNRLLNCSAGECANKKGWLCLADSNEIQVGDCYDPKATCLIQNGVVPHCSFQKSVLNVKVNHNCIAEKLTSGGTIDKCNFTWKLERTEFHGRENLFKIDWNSGNKQKVKNF